VQVDFPGLPVFGSLAELLDAGVDAVTITTPPHTRHDLVMEAIEAGVHVVADKPFAPNAQAARELAEAATRAGVVLNVYHNRRRDADILTLANVLASRELGETWRVHSTRRSPPLEPSSRLSALSWSMELRWLLHRVRPGGLR
jgi:predicted dehydrogenase